jgi:hypothetical protein
MAPSGAIRLCLVILARLASAPVSPGTSAEPRGVGQGLIAAVDCLGGKGVDFPGAGRAAAEIRQVCPWLICRTRSGRAS